MNEKMSSAKLKLTTLNWKNEDVQTQMVIQSVNFSDLKKSYALVHLMKTFAQQADGMS